MIIEEVDGTQNLNPEEGEGTEDKTQKPGAKDLIFGRFKTMDEAGKGYGELHSDYSRVVEKLRRLEAEKETDLDNIVGSKDSEIVELKKQLDELRRPPSARRYNPVEVKKYADLVAAAASGEEGASEQLIDYHRALAAYDHQMEERMKTETANKREALRQWNKIKEDYGIEGLKEISPEIASVLEKYPDLQSKAHENPDAMRDVVRLAEKMHEEKVEVMKAEQELRDAEKQQAGGGSPSSGGKGIEDDDKLSLEQLEQKYGWSPEGGPIPKMPRL